MLISTGKASGCLRWVVSMRKPVITSRHSVITSPGDGPVMIFKFQTIGPAAPTSLISSKQMNKAANK